MELALIIYLMENVLGVLLFLNVAVGFIIGFTLVGRYLYPLMMYEALIKPGRYKLKGNLDNHTKGEEVSIVKVTSWNERVDIVTSSGVEESWRKSVAVTCLSPVRSKILPVLIVIFTILCLIPGKQTAYAMLAAYGVTEVAKNEKVQEIAGTSLKVLEKAMNDYISEEPKKK